MNDLHMFEGVLGNGMVRAKCGLTSWSFRLVEASRISSPKWERICEGCFGPYYKEVSPDIHEVLLSTVVKRPSIAA